MKNEPWQDELLYILDKYYRVCGKNFTECTQMEVCNHQSFHLMKLCKKVVRHFLSNDTQSEIIVRNEVIPDLVIYSYELVTKFSLHNNVRFSDLNNGSSLSGEQIVLKIVEAGAALGDICDQFEHGQRSNFHLEDDVVAKYLDVCSGLVKLMNAELEVTFAKRLAYMVSKYENWDQN